MILKASVCSLLMMVALMYCVSKAQSQERSAQSAGRAPKNQAEFDIMFSEVSNWGRWGKNDQLGTLNLITDAKRRQAAALVKSGIAVSLSHTFVTEKAADNPNPFEVTQGGNRYSVQFHSTTHSHMDALCHMSYKERTYNGYPSKDVHTEAGCVQMNIETLKNGLTTRGVLIDIPRLKGVPYLEPGTPVFPEDIEAWEKRAGVKVGPGDAVFLYTGRWLRRQKLGPWCLVPMGACLEKGTPAGSGEAGYHASVAQWFKRRDVALVGADLSNDVFPSLVEGVPLPVHTLTIVALGALVLDAMDLEAAAETAARLGRWEFMLTGAPLAVAGGTGSPINLIALF
jgi:kynurenine formamidase